MVWATKYFRPYLYGRRFTIRTDHRPLVWLNNMKEPNSKLQRWKIKLNEFDFVVEYIKGKENLVADGLSRMIYDSKGNMTPSEAESTLFINLNELFNSDEANASNDMETIHSADTDDANFISITEKPINLFKNQIILGYATRESRKLKIIHKNKIRNTIMVTKETDLKNTMRECLPEKGLVAIFCANDRLFLKFQDCYRMYFANNKKLIILRSKIWLEDITDKEIILKRIETEHLRNNHRGINEVFNNLKETCYYPNLQREIQKYINNCEICNTAKFDRHPIKHAFNVTDSPEKQNDMVHIDLWYPQKSEMYLTSIDKLTKYATAEKLKDRTWISVIDGLKKRFQYLGKPRLIVMDNEFDTINVKQFLKENGIDFHLTTTYLKTGNSDVERLHSTLNEHIRLFNADPDNESDLEDKVHKAIIAYNNTIHTTTKTKPIHFITSLITREDLKEFSEQLHQEKIARTNAINRNQGKESNCNFGNKYVENYRVSKAQPKYKKVDNYRTEGNYLVSNNNKFKRKYKTQVKRKYLFQENHDEDRTSIIVGGDGPGTSAGQQN